MRLESNRRNKMKRQVRCTETIHQYQQEIENDESFR
jgi:hypothetical protein